MIKSYNYSEGIGHLGSPGYYNSGYCCIYYYDKNYKVVRQCSFSKDENISFLKKQMLPLEEIYWWESEGNRKWKIVDLKDNFEFRVVVYDKDFRIETDWYNPFIHPDPDRETYYSGYYYRGEKIEI